MGDSGILWIALGLLLTLPKRTRKIGLVILGAIGLMVVINNLALKSLFDRPRPFLIESYWWVEAYSYPGLISYPSGLSFPSGHSASAFAGAVAFLLGARKWSSSKITQSIAIASVGLAGLIAFSRLYLGVHYLSDIIVGSLVGVGCAFLALLAMRIAEPRLDRCRLFKS